MKKIITLYKFELLIQNRIYDLIKYLIVFFAFALVAVTLLNEHANIKNFGIIFCLIYYPLSLIHFSNFILKLDIEDGYLELLLTSFDPYVVIIAKFFAFITASGLSLIANLPIFLLFLDIWELSFTQKLLICLILLLLLTSSLLMLISTLQCYFRSNNNLLSLIILPLLLPGIIISGLILREEHTNSLILVLFSLNLILIPIVIILASNLLKNIYNI